MRKILFLFLIAVLFSACSVGKHYFNQRIDHPEQETAPGPVRQTTQVRQNLIEKPIKPAEEIREPVVADAASKHETVLPVKGALVHNPVPVKHMQSFQIQKAIVHRPSFKKRNPGLTSEADVDGLGIVLLVIAGLFLLVFLVSLLLGYTAGQAALYGLMAILILLIVGLVYLMRDDDDDNDEDEEDQ